MMILPLADALQNTLQNLTSRIAGVDNEQMAGRTMGMGAALGYSLGAIKEQFKTPNSDTPSNLKTNGNNTNGGIGGFVDRVKSVVNPTANLSDETDYNGNVNPIRNVIPKQNTTKTENKMTTPMQNKIDNTNNSKVPEGKKQKIQSIAGTIAKTGINATKTYLSVGANMAEGNFNQNPYKSKEKQMKNKAQSTEYIHNNLSNSRLQEKEKGDENEFKEKS